MRVLIVTIVISISISCSKKKIYGPPDYDIIITGMDYRKCFCCGGLMMNLTGDTVPYRSEFKLISNDPAELGISDSTKFPVRAKALWHNDDTKCIGTFVYIKKFSVQ